jgi:hypothetical protein
VDVVCLSKPSLLNDNIHITNYLNMIIGLIKLLVHKGMLIIIDKSLNEYSEEDIIQRIEMAPFVDLAAPVIESITEGIDYFVCFYDLSKSKDLSELLFSNSTDSLKVGNEFIKGVISK